MIKLPKASAGHDRMLHLSNSSSQNQYYHTFPLWSRFSYATLVASSGDLDRITAFFQGSNDHVWLKAPKIHLKSKTKTARCCFLTNNPIRTKYQKVEFINMVNEENQPWTTPPKIHSHPILRPRETRIDENNADYRSARFPGLSLNWPCAVR